MNIETNRLIIRDFKIYDADDLFEILGDADTMEGCEPAYDFEKTKRFLEEFCIGQKGALAAVHKLSNKVIGYILFKECTKKVYEIGWFFNKNYWRQGYAYESCHALIKHAFSNSIANKIFAETVDVQKSTGLILKLGMKLEEIQKDHSKDVNGNLVNLCIYSMIKE